MMLTLLFPGHPKWSSSEISISITSTTKTSTFYPKTSTGENIDWLKHRLRKHLLFTQKHLLAKTSTVKNINWQKHQLSKTSTVKNFNCQKHQLMFFCAHAPLPDIKINFLIKKWKHKHYWTWFDSIRNQLDMFVFPCFCLSDFNSIFI